MTKFKNIFPVTTPVLVGFLSLNKKIDKSKLIPLATVMLLSEDCGQDVYRMAQWLNADLTLADLFKMPAKIDVLSVWKWRTQGVKIISEAFLYATERAEEQLAYADLRDKNWEKTFTFQSSVMFEMFKSRLKKEEELAREVIRKGLGK